MECSCQIIKLSQTEDLAKPQLCAIEAQLSSTNDNIQLLRAALSAATDSKLAMEKELRAAHSELSEKRFEAVTARIELRRLNAELTREKFQFSEVEEMGKELKNLRCEKEALEGALMDSKARADEAQAGFEEMKEMGSRAYEQYVEAMQNVGVLEQAVEKLEGELQEQSVAREIAEKANDEEKKLREEAEKEAKRLIEVTNEEDGAHKVSKADETAALTRNLKDIQLFVATLQQDLRNKDTKIRSLRELIKAQGVSLATQEIPIRAAFEAHYEKILQKRTQAIEQKYSRERKVLEEERETLMRSKVETEERYIRQVQLCGELEGEVGRLRRFVEVQSRAKSSAAKVHRLSAPPGTIRVSLGSKENIAPKATTPATTSSETRPYLLGSICDSTTSLNSMQQHATVSPSLSGPPRTYSGFFHGLMKRTTPVTLGMPPVVEVTQQRTAEKF